MYISVDVEADGPCPGLYSMVSFGAVALTTKLDKTFYGEVCPISGVWVPEALAVSGVSREQHLRFENPKAVMARFADWIKEVSGSSSPIFIADNPAFDFAFINYYFHMYYGSNPFGYSARRISDLYCGMKLDMHAKWKWMRETTHSHNALDDAKGNAEALIKMKAMGLPIKIKNI